MGSVTLRFDRIDINNKRSDTEHNDNDWMTIFWFVQDQNVKTEVLQLAKIDGDTSLDTGSSIAPLSSSVDCADTDLVTAPFVVINLGSTDGAGQRAKAEAFADAMARQLTDVYVSVVQEVVKEGVPFGSVFSDGLDQVRTAIVDTVGTAFEDIIIPTLEEALGLLGIGPPNCDGEILHDIAVFSPDVSYPFTKFPPTYKPAGSRFCGKPPETSAVITQSREITVQLFPHTPPPKTVLVPAHGQAENLWLTSWAEDPLTPYPIVKVIIAPSLRASGLYSVSIQERVDPRYNVIYATAADPVSIHTSHVSPYEGNVFGSLRPWLAHPTAPINLRLTRFRIVNEQTQEGVTQSAGPVTFQAQSAGAQLALPTSPPEADFALAWTRPPDFGAPIGDSRLSTPAGSGPRTDLADTIDLPDRGIMLCLYEVQQSGQVIGHAIRYLRAGNLSYTPADVMLVRWKPL